MNGVHTVLLAYLSRMIKGRTPARVFTQMIRSAGD